MKNKYKGLIYKIATFLYIYDIGLKSLPTIFSSRKIIFLFLLLKFIFTQRKIVLTKKYLNYFIITLIILFYILSIAFFYHTIGDEFSIIPRVFYFFIFGVIGSYLIYRSFDNLIFFLNCIKTSGIIQSVVIYLLFTSNSFRVFSDKVFINEGNVSFLRVSDRGTGLGAEGAYLTILLFLAVFACIYLIQIKHKQIINAVYLLIIVMMMFLVGRTGVYATIFLIILTLLRYNIINRNWSIKNIIITLSVITISLCFIFFIISLADISNRISKLVNVFLGLFISKTGDRSLLQLSEMIIPPLNESSFFGFAIYRGDINGVISQHDSGVVQSFFAMGLIISILFYANHLLYVIKNYMKCKDNLLKFMFRIYLFILILVELKEPIILKTIPFFFMIICLNISESEENNGKNINNCTNL